jgi:hypothetical protein
MEANAKAADLGLGPPVNMAEVRGAQRRLGTMVYACELETFDPLWKTEMLESQASIQCQHHANTVIDEVVEKECTPVIASREAEWREMVQCVGIALENQNERLYRSGILTCAHYRTLAQLWEKNTSEESRMDTDTEGKLDHLRDQFDDLFDDTEDAIREQVKAVRNAPDMNSLEHNKRAVLETLATLENGYREFHTKSSVVMKEHPVAAKQQSLVVVRDICAHLDIEVPETEDQRKERLLVALGALPAPAAAPIQSAVVEGEDDGGEDGGAAAAVEAEVSPRSAVGGAANPQGEEGGDAEGGGEGGEEGGGEEGSTVKSERALSPRVDLNDFKEEVALTSLGDVACLRRTLWDDGAEATICALHTPLMERAVALADPPEEDEGSDQDDEFSPRPGSGDVGEGGGDVGEDVDGGGGAEGGPGSESSPRKSAGGETPRSQTNPDGEPGDGGDGGEEVAAEEAAAAEPVEEVVPEPFPWEKPLPYMENNQTPCMEQIVIEPLVVLDMLGRLRGAVLNELGQSQEARDRQITGLFEKRKEQLLQELEERLRKHWPRKGRIDMESHQPREGELLAHRQKLDRHLRSMREKGTFIAAQFDKRLQKAQMEVKNYKKKQKVLLAQLGMQQNLAQLQVLKYPY